jgi:hypothetical protein
MWDRKIRADYFHSLPTLAETMINAGNRMSDQILKSFWLILRALSISIFIALGTTTSPLPVNSQESFNLRNSRWQVRITPARLGIWGKPIGAAQEITLASPTDQAGLADDLAGL